MSFEDVQSIEVAAGVLTDARGRVLLMRRKPGTHLAGAWEFPGGKLELDETIETALARELREELGVHVRASAPLISLPWRYREKMVRLHVRRVIEWSGELHAREGHPLRWLPLEEIDPREMPAADRPVVAALRLPPFYAISPDSPKGDAASSWLHSTNRGALLQLRLPRSDRGAIRDILRGAVGLNPSLRARLLVNGDIELAREFDIGVHLRAAQLREMKARPLPEARWVGASCHDAEELDRAVEIGVDFATLSPVRVTASHPDATPLGWERFQHLVREARLPVYALGGLGVDDLQRAREAGAQGVAGISAFARA